MRIGSSAQCDFLGTKKDSGVWSTHKGEKLSNQSCNLVCPSEFKRLANISGTHSTQCAQNGYDKDIQLWTCKCSEGSEWKHFPLPNTIKNTLKDRFNRI